MESSPFFDRLKPGFRKGHKGPALFENGLLSFNDPDILLRQPIQLVNHPVDLFVSCFYLCLDIQRFLLLLNIHIVEMSPEPRIGRFQARFVLRFKIFADDGRLEEGLIKGRFKRPKVRKIPVLYN